MSAIGGATNERRFVDERRDSDVMWSFIFFAASPSLIPLSRISSESLRGDDPRTTRLDAGVSWMVDETVVLEEDESIEYLLSSAIERDVRVLSCLAAAATELISDLTDGSTTVVVFVLTLIEKYISSSSLSLHPRPRVSAVPFRRCAGDILRVEGTRSDNIILGDGRAAVDRGEITRSFKATAESGWSRSRSLSSL